MNRVLVTGGAGTIGAAVARRLLRRGREPDQIAQMHVGAVDAGLWAARACLDDAAARVDDGRATGDDGGLLALRVRHVVARAAESVVERVGHATGPAPLALDDDHAARVADLQLYLRQEHAERDEAALGLVLGTVFGVSLTRALSGQGIEVLVVPGGRLAAFLLIGAVIGVLAAVWPARRAAKLQVLDAIATS